jgi:hypothetical protein
LKIILYRKVMVRIIERGRSQDHVKRGVVRSWNEEVVRIM